MMSELSKKDTADKNQEPNGWFCGTVAALVFHNTVKTRRKNSQIPSISNMKLTHYLLIKTVFGYSFCWNSEASSFILVHRRSRLLLVKLMVNAHKYPLPSLVLSSFNCAGVGRTLFCCH